MLVSRVIKLNKFAIVLLLLTTKTIIYLHLFIVICGPNSWETKKIARVSHLLCLNLSVI